MSVTTAIILGVYIGLALMGMARATT